MEIKTDKINISGRIDVLLSHIPSELRTNKLLEGMVDRPIMNNGKVIGIITEYNLETGFWNGFIWSDVYPSIMENYICSVELKQ